jgi:[ribosomal protein S5]-alanine N-acetyltransferase
VTYRSAEPTELRTSRLLLRPFRREDADAVFSMYRDDEVAYYMLPGPITRDDVEQSLANPKPWADRPHFAVVFEGQVVGDVVLEIGSRDAVANLGYAVARQHWGKGFATEAARAVVDYGFRTFGLAKIYARADPRNVASVRVMEKLGMRREALLRSHVLRRGERCDRVYYGLLREEWSPGVSDDLLQRSGEMRRIWATEVEE